MREGHRFSYAQDLEIPSCNITVQSSAEGTLGPITIPNVLLSIF